MALLFKTIVLEVIQFFLLFLFHEFSAK